MPVSVIPLGSGRLIISGEASLKLTSFQIEPPAPIIALGLIKTGDEVTLRFEWVVAPKGTPSKLTQSELAPLLDLQR
jgi:hypothetical protein